MTAVLRRHGGWLAALVVISSGITSAPHVGTDAAWSDTAALTTSTFTAGAAPEPVTGLTCQSGVLGLLSVRFAWTAQTKRSYRVIITNTATNATLADTVVTTNSYTQTSGFPATNNGATLRVDVVSQVPSTPGTWPSAAVSRNFRQDLGGLTFTCL